MGEIGNNFLPEDIFADVESDISNNVVRKNDQHMEEMVQDDNKANINQKKGKNFDKKHISKTSKKLFLVVLLFVFLLILLFVFIDVVSKLSVKSAKKLQNNVKNNIVVNNNKSSPSPVLKDTDGDGLMDVEEINFGTNVNLFDTDGDFISDGDEIKTYKTSPLNPDTDGDGLSDYDEIFIYKTNPLSSDTDGDGYRDMDEINNGYSPLDSSKMSEEYLKSIEEGKKLKLEKLKTKN